MFKNKPVTLLIAAGLVLLLIAAAGVYPLISGSLRGVGRMGNFDRSQMPTNGQRPEGGNFQQSGTPPANMTAPQGSRSGESQGNNSTGSNSQFPQGQWNGSTSGFSTSGSSVSMKLLQLLQVVEKVGGVAVILFGVLAILGILLGKDWGRKLAVTAGIVAILFTVAGMFGFSFGISLWVKIGALVLAVAVLVLSFLPKSRLTATVPA